MGGSLSSATMRGTRSNQDSKGVAIKYSSTDPKICVCTKLAVRFVFEHLRHECALRNLHIRLYLRRREHAPPEVKSGSRRPDFVLLLGFYITVKRYVTLSKAPLFCLLSVIPLLCHCRNTRHKQHFCRQVFEAIQGVCEGRKRHRDRDREGLGTWQAKSVRMTPGKPINNISSKIRMSLHNVW